METLLKDFRFGVRALKRSPGFTIVAASILSLGIGANSAIFTLINGLFLRRPPTIESPERLVRVSRVTATTRSGPLSYPDFEFYRENNDVFSDLAAFDDSGVLLTARRDEQHSRVEAWLVSDNFFNVLGVRPALGRLFVPDENVPPGTNAVAVISHAFWRRLGAEADVIGTSLALNGQPFTIVGVAAEGFRGIGPADSPPDLWVPISMQPAVMPGVDMLRRVEGTVDVWLQSIGRLRDGVEIDAAQANMQAVADQLEERYAAWNEGASVALTQHFQYSPRVRRRLLSLSRLLLGAAGLVLLVACANLAILLLARAADRRKELGVRLALGADRGRVVRQLVTESLILAIAGGIVGLMLAAWLGDLARPLMPINLYTSFTPDWKVVGFTFSLATLTTVFFGFTPAWLAARQDIAVVLKGVAENAEKSPLRSGLVVAQITLAIFLIAGAGLFLRSFLSAQSVDIGFKRENRLVSTIDLRKHGYGDERGRAFIEQILPRVSGLPGVQSATTTRIVPLSQGMWTGGVEAKGVQPPSGQDYFDTGINVVGPDYFRTLGVPLIAGRDIEGTDRHGAAPSAVVNEALAELIWPGENPIGRAIGRGDVWFTVVGLAPNFNYYELGEDPYPQLFLPILQYYQPRLSLLVHTRGNPSGTARVVEEEIHALDADIVVSNPLTLDEVFSQRTSSYRVLAILVTLFGLLALLLAAVGLYGVLSYLVARRTREIGIRMALGAERKRLAVSIITRGLRLTLLGVGIGLFAALLAARALTSFLFGITPQDPATFALVPLVITGTAVLASYLPARRAASVDPMEALRYD